MTEMLIALGANLPTGAHDPASTLAEAVARLAASPGIDGLRESRWYRSPAVPEGSGPDFVNGAAAVSTRLTPEELLERLHAIEAGLGRTRPERWAPRVCDLDLLAAKDLVLPDAATVAKWMALSTPDAMRRAPDRLILPHPRLHERAFVLVPLCDVAPDWVHPVTGRSVSDMAAALPATERAGVTPLGPSPAS